jgi:glycosyltransferase involved in cell wall biosynthesis
VGSKIVDPATAAARLVSVCLPTYNRRDKLENAVRSIQQQVYRNVEIIISDNASTDGTRELCLELQRDDERIKYFRQEKNVGPTANFEFARAQAQGRYFMWHSDDDWIDERYIEACVERLEEDHSLSLVSGLGAYHRGDGVLVNDGKVIQLGVRLGFLRILKYLSLVTENSIYYGVYRTERVRACNLSNELAGDWMWVCDVLAQGRALVVPEVRMWRAFGDSNSESFERLVRVLELPQWKMRSPWLAIATGVAAHLANRLPGRPPQGVAYRATLAGAAFLTILVRSGFQKLLRAASGMPLARTTYRRFARALSGVKRAGP